MKAEIHMMHIIKTTTMNVTVKERKQFKLRFWLGCKLIILAAYIIGTKIEITTTGKGIRR